MRRPVCLALALCWRVSSAFTKPLVRSPPPRLLLLQPKKRTFLTWGGGYPAAATTTTTMTSQQAPCRCLATRASLEEEEANLGVETSPDVEKEKPKKKTRTRKAPVVPVSSPPPPPVRFESHEDFVQGLLGLTGDPLEDDNGRIVVYRGNPKAKLMVIGEAPGEMEDQLGLPFVGRSGQLLDKILESVQLDVKTDVYVSNVVRRRPPNNRGPTVGEVEYYKPYLLEEIRLVDPYIIVLTGSYSMRAILDEKQGITKVRGQWYTRVLGGEGGIDGKGTRECMTIFHPSYLLRNPSRVVGGPKSLTWQDVQEVRRRLDELVKADKSGDSGSV